MGNKGLSTKNYKLGIILGDRRMKEQTTGQKFNIRKPELAEDTEKVALIRDVEYSIVSFLLIFCNRTEKLVYYSISVSLGSLTSYFFSLLI